MDNERLEMLKALIKVEDYCKEHPELTYVKVFVGLCHIHLRAQPEYMLRSGHLQLMRDKEEVRRLLAHKEPVGDSDVIRA